MSVWSWPPAAGGGGGGGGGTPAAHAPTHDSGGTDPITALGTVTTKSLRSLITSIAYGAAVTLDVNLANDFAISTLTGNTTITWANAQLGNQGSVVVRQDATGGRTVTFTAPAPYVLMRDSALADLSAASSPNAFTVFTWAFVGVSPTAVLLMSKITPV